MYAIKSVQGNICYIMDLDGGESDLELTKAETFDTVKNGNSILGVNPANREIINLATVVMVGMKNKGASVRAMRDCKVEIVGDARKYFSQEIEVKRNAVGDTVSVVNLKYVPNAKIALKLAGII